MDAVARGARLIAHHHALLTQQCVHQRGLADIGFADHGDARDIFVRLDFLRHRQFFQHALDQFVDALAMRGGDGRRFAKPQGIKFPHDRGRVAPFRLVHREPHRLAQPAQIRGQHAVDRVNTLERIHDKNNGVGLRQRGAHLGGDPGRHVLAILRRGQTGHDTAGVHDKIGTIADPAVAVLTVARQARRVSHQRAAAAGQPVEQRGFADIGPADENDDGFHMRI